MQVFISISLDCPESQRWQFSLLCNDSMRSLAEYTKPFLDGRIEKDITKRLAMINTYLEILYQLSFIIILLIVSYLNCLHVYL